MFCPNCETQIPKDTNVCPECQTPTDNPKPQTCQATIAKGTPSNKNLNKFNVVIAIVLIINVLLSAINTFLIVSNSNTGGMANGSYNSGNSNDLSSEKSNDSNNIFTTDVTTPCPADEYGNHAWESATCEHPAYCWNCGVYKDDKLGNHAFKTDEDTGLIECYRCNMLKSDYDKEE